MASNVLKAFASQYFPQQFLDEMLTEIDQTGTISDETLAKAGIKKPSTINFIKAQIKDFVPKQDLKDLSNSELRRLSGIDQATTVDESQLTNDALKTRQDIFNQIDKTPGVIDPAELERQLTQQLSAANVHKESIPTVAKDLSKQILALGRYPTSQEFRQSYGGLISPELAGFFDNQGIRDNLSGFIHGQLKPYSSDQVYEGNKRIEDILGTRATTAKNEGELQNFIQDLPDELAGSRDSYIKALREQSQGGFEQFADQALGTQNAAGRLFSGATQDVLSAGATGYQQNIEDIQAQLLNEDSQLYFNAAYQEQLRKMLEGQANYGEALASERGRIQNEQENRFQVGEQSLNTNLENTLQQQKYNNAVTQAQKAAQRAQDYAKQQKKAGLFGQIGNSAGTGLALGALLAAPTGGLSLGAGAAIGAGSGAAVGGIGSQL